MANNVSATFVSEKVSKIRWRPDPFNDCHSFVTGSYDNDQNNIKLWDFRENERDSEVYPFILCNNEYEGDVTELKFLNPDNFVASSSLGSVHLFKIKNEYGKELSIETERKWSNIHKFATGEESPCTGFSIYDTDIATVGEDGRINLLTFQANDIVRQLDDADSCSIKCVTFLKHNELLTINLRGQMKIWDIRSAEDKPVGTFMMSGDQITPTCLQYHPTQRHLVIAGDDEGSLTVWDLRNNTYPVNLLNAHEDSVLEVHFHPDQPDHLFSCSSAGELWHWSSKSRPASVLNENSDFNLWLTTENVKNKLEVFALIPKLHKPINTLDINKNNLLCGCDNEAIYLISYNR